MQSNRLEAFSDGVIAIIITIMVLELKVPEGATLHDLVHSVPSVATYLLSFVYVGIYWLNHHHMFQLTQRVSGAVLWANLALLWFLSLFPFTTAWMDDSAFARVPVVVYGANLLAAALAYTALQRTIFRAEGENSLLRAAVGKDAKGKVSVALYFVGIALCFVAPWLGLLCFTVVALLWFIPDRRLERYLAGIHTAG